MINDIGEFRQHVKKFEVACKVPGCSYTGHSLVEHLRETHKLTAGQYKKSYPESALVSPMVTDLLRRLNRDSFFKDNLDKVLPDYNLGDEVEQAVRNAAKSMKPVPPEQANLIPKEDDGFLLTEKAHMVAFSLIRGKNLFVEGPTGCGKTQEILQVHAKMGRPVVRVNMQGDVTVSNFLGQMEANAAGTFFREGALPLAMKGGYTLLVDEVDYAPPHIAAILNSVLEGERSLYVPETGERIKAAEGFTVMATANTGGKGDSTGTYAGTEVLNTAFLDRFSVKLKSSYLDEKSEINMLLKRFPSADKKLVTTLVRGAKEIREAFLQGKISITMSTRKLVDFMEFLPTLGQETALKVTLLNWMDTDDLSLVTSLLDRVGLTLKGIKTGGRP